MTVYGYSREPDATGTEADDEAASQVVPHQRASSDPVPVAPENPQSASPAEGFDPSPSESPAWAPVTEPAGSDAPFSPWSPAVAPTPTSSSLWAAAEPVTPEPSPWSPAEPGWTAGATPPAWNPPEPAEPAEPSWSAPADPAPAWAEDAARADHDPDERPAPEGDLRTPGGLPKRRPVVPQGLFDSPPLDAMGGDPHSFDPNSFDPHSFDPHSFDPPLPVPPPVEPPLVRPGFRASRGETGAVPTSSWEAAAPRSPAGPSEPAPPPARSPIPAADEAPAAVNPDLVFVPGVDDDDDDIVPWDRRPLMVVIAAGTALIALAILSGVATASMFGTKELPAAWRAPQTATDPGLTASPSAVPGGPGAGVVDPDSVTLSGVGDVIMGSMPGDVPPNNGAGFFDPVKDAIAADVAMGNLETPLTNNTGKVKCPLVTPTADAANPSPKPVAQDGCHQFYLPPSYASYVKDAGFRVMNLANNHTNDMGPEGLSNTRAALEAVGVQHTGAPNQITYLEVKGIKVAVIGFSVYSWGQSLNNISAAETLVRKADQQADLVLIQMQGGAEGADKTHVKPGKEIYLGEDRGDLVKFSHAMIDAGADAVFGHGPHVMRGMEFYKGRIIAYSLGNFCGYGVLSATGNLGVGGILKVTLKKDGTWVGGQLVATEMVKGGMPAPDPAKRALAIVGGLSKEDFGAAAASISPTDGQITAPASS